MKLLSFIGFLLIRVVCLTIGYKQVNRGVREQCRRTGQRYIYAFWHGRQFLLLGWNPDKRVVVMTSLSRDGRLQDKILRRLGFYTVDGSSTRGAVRGLVAMIRGMRAGYNACVAVDGPRGPFQVVKPGIIYLAARTGSVIIPLTSRAKYRHTFQRAWDKYELPRPFSPAVVILGEPISVPPDADDVLIEAKRQELEQTLQAITHQADNYFTNN